MNSSHTKRSVLVSMVILSVLVASAPDFGPPSAGRAAAAEKPAPKGPPERVYVPYEKLKGVFDSEKQGVFLPYAQFERLWRAARGAPAGVTAAPTPYLISTARFSGKVGRDLADMQLELTVDVLADGWVQVPIALGEVAVNNASFGAAEKSPVLLRIVKGSYVLVTKGRGRKVLKLNFVRQLETKPGLNVLSFRIPPAAISTLELLIPAENMKVQVRPMLAATTTQVAADGGKATRLQAFLGSADSVRLSWKPTTQAAADLTPVIISNQFQHINVAEALITHEVKFTYDIRRRRVDSFVVQLPDMFRVVSVEGENIAKWDVVPGRAGAPQTLHVKLFSPAKPDKGGYTLTVKMERFLKESQVTIPLSPIVTREVLRRAGLIAITHSPRRSVELRDARKLARVDTGRLDKRLRGQPGVTAHRFITADYGGKLVIGTVEPRISARQYWALGVADDRLELRGRLDYNIERVGVFRLAVNLPEPWEVVEVGPANIVDDHELRGEGRGRMLHVLLKREVAGNVRIELAARMPRTAPDADVSFELPLADAKNLHLYAGQLVLHLAGRLQAEVAGLDQFQSMPVSQAQRWVSLGGLSPAMAFGFRAVDRARPSGARFRIAVRPAQVSAVVHRLVNIRPGSVEQEAVIQYRVLYAPVDTFYLKMPAALADAGVQISGRDIKEKPRIAKLPPDLQPEPAKPEADKPEADKPATTRPDAEAIRWAYYKVVLQSPVIGAYELKVRARRAFQAAATGQTVTVGVEPILAAGKLSDQSGHIAVAKADTLAVVEPVSRNLVPADPGSRTDLPYAAHRRVASLAFRYSRPPFELSLPVVARKEAAVFTTIATAAVIEQVLARDGRLNGHAIFLLATSKGDRLPVMLPAGAKLLAVLLNGSEVPVELGATADERIVRLPPSAGQVTKLVLEISYGLQGASGSDLLAPALPKDVPVQQTLWRLWVPDEDYLLHFDRVFSRLRAGQAETLLTSLAAGQPAGVAFKLSPQGRVWDFTRQGAPGKLSVTLVGREVFSIAVWVLVLAVGAAMLKLGGLNRSLIVLAGLLAAGVLRLFAPLLVRSLVLTGAWAALLVAGLWAAQWLFLRLPAVLSKRRGRPFRAAPPPAPAPPQAPPGADDNAPKTRGSNGQPGSRDKE